MIWGGDPSNKSIYNNSNKNINGIMGNSNGIRLNR
jgi:hypothetical protein